MIHMQYTEALSTFLFVIDRKPEISFLFGLQEATLYIVHAIIAIGANSESLDKFTKEKGLDVLVDHLYWPKELKNVIDEKKTWKNMYVCTGNKLADFFL